MTPPVYAHHGTDDVHFRTSAAPATGNALRGYELGTAARGRGATVVFGDAGNGERTQLIRCEQSARTSLDGATGPRPEGH
jgi:hypothetical protein